MTKKVLLITYIFSLLSLYIFNPATLKAADLEMPPTTQIVKLHSSGTSVELYAVSPTMKILPMQTIEPTLINDTYQKIYLAGAPGESEQIQLVIKPNSDVLALNLAFPNLAGASQINKDNWSYQKVENVIVPNVSTHYGIWGGEIGYVPDPVVKTNSSVKLIGSQYNTVLLKLNIPRGLLAGKYVGNLTLTIDGSQTTIPIELNVWGFEFPTDKQMITYACGVDLGKNAKVLDLLKGTVNQVKYGSNKLIVGFPNNELSILTKYYVAEMNKLRDEYGIEKAALPPSLLGQINTLSDSYLNKRIPVGSTEFYDLHKQFLTLMRDSMRAAGLQNNIMYYPMDEFNEILQPAYIGIARQSKEIFPEMPILALAPYMSKDVAQYSDAWCIPWHFFSTLENDPPMWKEYNENGLDLWGYMNSLYTINANWNPKGMRFFPVILSRYNHNGALWWAMNSYSGQDVWTTAGTAENNNLYGLGYLVYPPRENETEWHSSLRWESYTQGTEDYRLMELLKERWNNTASQLNATSGNFSSYNAMQMFGGMLSSSFRVQSYFAEPLYIDRFRQIVAHEISTLPQTPLSLIMVQPFDTRQNQSVTVQGIVELGATVTVNGNSVSNINSSGEFNVNVPLSQNGLNLIKIDITKSGVTKTVYREVRSNVISGVETIYGNNKDLLISENAVRLPYAESKINTVKVYNLQGQTLLTTNKSNSISKHHLNPPNKTKNIYFVKVYLDDSVPVTYKILW